RSSPAGFGPAVRSSSRAEPEAAGPGYQVPCRKCRQGSHRGERRAPGMRETALRRDRGRAAPRAMVRAPALRHTAAACCRRTAAGRPGLLLAERADGGASWAHPRLEQLAPLAAQLMPCCIGWQAVAISKVKPMTGQVLGEAAELCLACAAHQPQDLAFGVCIAQRQSLFMQQAAEECPIKQAQG